MTNDANPNEPQAPEPVANNGHLLLAQAREAADMPLDALSLALKVPVKRLASLEAGRYEELPDMTFARALAMSVCRHLQIDPQRVLERMPTAHVAQLGAKGVVGGDAMYSTGEGLALSPVSALRRPPALVAVALVLAAALLYSLPESRVEAPAPQPPVAQTPVADALEPQAETEPSPVTTEAAPAPATAPATVPATVPVPDNVPVPFEPAAIAPVVPNPAMALQVSAQDETWFEVTRPDGTVLVSRLLQAGDVVDLGSSPPYTVVLGRASVAQLFLRGQAIALAPHTRGDVARYEVK